VTAGANLYVPSGNVGIGTSSPAYKLEVTSTNGIIGATGSAGYGAFTATGSGTNSSYIFFRNATNGEQARITSQNGGTLIFGQGNSATDRMVIESNGYLLVGYSSSNGAYKLQVNSQIFATSSTIATSDARYKQNVETLNGALSIVKALRPVSFDWKKHPVHAFDTENTTVGFLAQEVQQVLADKPYLNSIIKKNECVIKPEIKNEDGVVTMAAVTEEFLGIAEGNMLAILTSALQELSTKNDALEARLVALEAK